MTFNYASLQNAAERLIDKFGRSVTLRRVIKGNYVPETLSVSGNSETDTTVIIAFTSYEEREIDGSVIKRHDQRGYMKAKNVSLASINDIIIDGSVQYQIMNVRETKPANTGIFYELQLRK